MRGQRGIESFQKSRRKRQNFVYSKCAINFNRKIDVCHWKINRAKIVVHSDHDFSLFTPPPPLLSFLIPFFLRNVLLKKYNSTYSLSRLCNEQIKIIEPGALPVCEGFLYFLEFFIYFYLFFHSFSLSGIIHLFYHSSFRHSRVPWNDIRSLTQVSCRPFSYK